MNREGVTMHSTEQSLAGKIAIVTGAASGIGAGIAGLFAAHGCRVVIADIDKVAGQTTAQELGEHGLFCHLDVTSEESWRQLMARVNEHLSLIHI